MKIKEERKEEEKNLYSMYVFSSISCSPEGGYISSVEMCV